MFKTFRQLDGKSRWIFILVIVYSVVSPVLDLIFFRLLSKLLTSDHQTTTIAGELLPILGILLISNCLKYITKLKKILYANKFIENISNQNIKGMTGSINWLRVGIIEAINSLIAISHVFIISLISIFINPMMGGMVLLVALLSFLGLEIIFRKEIFNQRKIKYNRKVKSYQKGELNVVSRIKSSERSRMIIRFFVLLYFLALISIFSVGHIETHTALIFLFLTRFIDSNLGNVSSSFMRIARGWVYVENRYKDIMGKLSL